MLDRHPEWLPFVEPTESEVDGLTVHTLTINLPSQHPTFTEPLSISVDLGKLIVLSWFKIDRSSRWDYDWIFYMVPIAREPNWAHEYVGVDIILEFIERFMTEEIAAIWHLDTSDNVRTISYLFVSAADINQNKIRRDGEITEIRSWKGTLDATFTHPKA